MLRILMGEPFNYEIDRQRGSHRILKSTAGHPQLTFSFHDGQTLGPGMVKKVLMKDLGLTEDEAREVF